MDLNLIASTLSIGLGIITLFVGIWVAGRCLRELRISAIFLTAAAVVLVVKGIVEIINLPVITSNIISIHYTVQIVMSLLILFAILNIGSMINRIDGHYKKK